MEDMRASEDWTRGSETIVRTDWLLARTLGDYIRCPGKIQSLYIGEASHISYGLVINVLGITLIVLGVFYRADCWKNKSYTLGLGNQRVSHHFNRPRCTLLEAAGE